MSENQKPFIPSWLDSAGLSPSEFRIYCHLCRRADNDTGIAWPSYLSMIETCGSGKSTIRRSLESLTDRGLIAKLGKPFGGSCRYSILLPTSAKEVPVDASNSSTTGTIDDAPIVPPQDCNSPSGGTSIVPPQGHKGNPIRVSNKVLQKKEVFPELPFPSEAFLEAWQSWQQHRREKKKPVTPTSAKMQFKELLGWGEERSIAAIHHSIAKGWQGIYEASGQNGTGKPHRKGEYEQHLELP